MTQTNPHGANANVEDPREQVMWDFYVETIKAGSPNAYKCAIDAGYSDTHAKNITRQEWFTERSRNMKSVERVEKSEKVFDEILEMDARDGKDEMNPQLLKIKADISKFLATTQGKNSGYTTKTEVDHTSKGDKITAIGALIQGIEEK